MPAAHQLACGGSSLVERCGTTCGGIGFSSGVRYTTPLRDCVSRLHGRGCGMCRGPEVEATLGRLGG
jgi:hypothetical protein